MHANAQDIVGWLFFLILVGLEQGAINRAPTHFCNRTKMMQSVKWPTDHLLVGNISVLDPLPALQVASVYWHRRFSWHAAGICQPISLFQSARIEAHVSKRMA